MARRASCSASERSPAGFTLIELLVVVGILAILLGGTLVIGVDFYRGSSLRGERDVLVSVLRRARSEALADLYRSGHGLSISDSQYVVFAGSSYASRTAAYDEPYPRSAGFTISGPAEIDFSALDAAAGASGTIAISNGAQTSTISINGEGRIDW